MMDFMMMFLVGWSFGLVMTALNLSPYYAALSLVVAAGFGCGILATGGAAFLSLVLFLIYLGGMLVVFAYTAALAAEPYPEGLGERYVLLNLGVYVVGMAGFYLWGWGVEGLLVIGDVWASFGEFADLGGFDVVSGDVGGVSCVYSWGAGLLVVSAWGLFVCLLVVLELVRGRGRGGLRAP